MAARLRVQRDKTTTNPLLVLCVSRQIPHKDFFFVEKLPKRERHHRGDRNEAPVRAERERRSEDIECPARTWIRLPWVCIAPILVHEFPDLAFFPLLANEWYPAIGREAVREETDAPAEQGPERPVNGRGGHEIDHV
jgi:hypothetical protein